jgi:hypothetical protein
MRSIKNCFSKNQVITLILICLLGFCGKNQLYAQGPNAPEASGFEPVSATDMVNLSSGDLAYVLPLLDIDGFPVTLSYHGGIPMEMEATWTGLGWNINTGAIARGVVANPDDWTLNRGMKFTYYSFEEEIFTVNVGVGFGKAAEIGVGLSWGSNKSLSGSVSASMGPVSASIDTDGNYSVGLNSSVLSKKMGFKDIFNKPGGANKDKVFGGSLSISGNVNRGGITAGVGVVAGDKGVSSSMGISVSGNGVGSSFSIGGQTDINSTKTSAGAGGSVGSFSMADMSISTSGFYIPISIKIFNFGFGYQKQKVRYSKGLHRYGFGSLYQERFSALYRTDLGEKGESNVTPEAQFNDLQRRNYFGDTYDQTIPQNENEYIGDYKSAIEKTNFTFIGYDSYEVNVSGLSGSLSPLIGKNTVVIGEGFEGDDTDNSSRKMKVYYHSAQEHTSSLHPTNTLSSKNLYFSFNGRVNSDVNISGNVNTLNNSTSSLNLRNLVTSSNAVSTRPTSGSFVEVFTNSQLDNGDKNKMLLPSTVFIDNSSSRRRVEDLGYMSTGIGGYKVTAPDGKVYHFAQPVYQYEKVEHNYIYIDSENKSRLNSTSTRSGNPYATHWLLTAITGPDFIDDGNNFPDENDLGYWVRLDYGKWSNAYAWRTPYANSELMFDVSRDNSIKLNDFEGFARKYRQYNTYNEQNVDKVDAGHFMQGRKDLYYLDKIVTKNNVAYFVKNIREDALGTDLDYVFDEGSNNTTFNGESNMQVREDAKYETEYQLLLDKIIVEKNNGANTHVATNSGVAILNGVSEQTQTNRYLSSGIFSQNLPTASKTHKLHQTNSVLDINDFANYDYSKARKVIQFNYNYELAKQSPSSISATKGRLSLKSVDFQGRNRVKYMPPYRFSYQRPDQTYNTNLVPSSKDEPIDKTFKDSWGFIEGEDTNGKTLADSWSLNKIETPQGSTVEIEYEEDDFYVEAFSRRYWTENLAFNITENNDHFIIKVKNDPNISPEYIVNLADYFEEGDNIYLDLWICRAMKSIWLANNVYFSKFNLTADNIGTVEEVDDKINDYDDEISIRITKVIGMYQINPSVPLHLDHGYYTRGSFIQTTQDGPNKYENVPRGDCYNVKSGQDRYSMVYKLLATKSPIGNQGGGLRVSKITVNGDAGEKYETTYNYGVPGLNHYKSSGITSFFPVYGTKFVPYQSELPGPGVMYEWVTMQAKGYTMSGQELPSDKTEYHYYTLQPNFHIFDPNFTMMDATDDDFLFKATVVDKGLNLPEVEAKEIKIEKNLGKIGQLISTAYYNSEGHLMNKTTNSYKKKDITYQETFSSMKSIYSYNFSNGNFSNKILKGRLLSVSSKKDYNQILESITSVTPFGTSSIEYDNIDPLLGSYRTSIRTLSDGTITKEDKFPAYEVYPEMGSKADNTNYKNMLTQEAMHTTSVKILGEANYKTTNASVTTWNNNWAYRDELGITESPTLNAEKVWRKHKTFIWEGNNVDSNGTYGEELDHNDFNWGVDATQTRTEWKNVSEVTRYSHWSIPLETKDINNNFAASKMSENWSKVDIAGNARYTELYYSGAEQVFSGNSFDGEVKGANFRQSGVAHTGEYSVKNNSTGDKVFEISGSTSLNHNDISKDFRPGKYKISFWMHKPGVTTGNQDGAQVYINGSQQSIGETVSAGNWKLYNYYVDLPKNSTINIYVTNNDASGYYFDDFRMHPIYASVSSFVYDKDTDELTYILNANNIATKYVYDPAGRLCKTYQEVISNGTNIGGFKPTSKNEYFYKGLPVVDCGDCCTD